MRPTLTTMQFQTLAQQIAEYSGFLLDGSRHRSLESALAVRLEALGIDHLSVYVQQLNTQELQRLTELVVNHETQFFRTPAHHRALREQILPQLHHERKPGQALRCWSAGCSTGEEPYSLAITALETLGDSLPQAVEIYGTDISAQALAKAQAAQYRGRTLTNVSADQLKRRFAVDSGMFVVQSDVRSLVKFEQHNLHAAFPSWARALDLISCQNVTIYFSVDVCRALMARFFDALAPGGYLFLGFSETLWRIFDRFETVEVAGAYVYRKPVPRVRVAQPPVPVRAVPVARPVQAATPAQRLARATETLTQTFYEQGMAQLEAGALDAALRHLQQVKPDHPSYPRALASIARIHADRGDWQMAAAEARRAVELDVLTHDAHLLLGMLSANQEQWDEAVAHFERVRYLDGRAALPSFHLANAYRGQQRLDLAEREYRSTLRKLADLDATIVLDGVTVAWLRETCQRFLQHLEQERVQPR